ncbi:MAG: hypothetical protein WBP58_14540 [Chitinophagaceae bacterium]
MALKKNIFISFVVLVFTSVAHFTSRAFSSQGFHKVQILSNKELETIFTLEDSVEVAVRIGNINKDTVSTNLLIANKGLRIILKGYPKDFVVRIIQFSTTVVDRNMDTIATNVRANGNLFTIEQIDGFRKLDGKGKIIFDDIYVVGESARIRRMPSFYIIIRG